MSDLGKIFEVITEQSPRRIAVSYDDWGALADEMTTRRGCIKKKVTDTSRVTYVVGDQHAYVLGVFVFWAADLNRGEMRAEK